MLGDFITRSLLMLLGYAYPAFECYKTVEKNKVEIEELRFWCQYWIIVAMLSVTERIADIFISWLPMYGEMKLAFIVYLWYPKTKGTGYVYGTVLRPYIATHESDIDRKIMELKARAWDLFLVYYWQHCAKFGQNSFVQMLQFLATQSAWTGRSASEEEEDGGSAKPTNPDSKKASTTTVNHGVAQPSKPKNVQVPAETDGENPLHAARLRLRRNSPD